MLTVVQDPIVKLSHPQDIVGAFQDLGDVQQAVLAQHAAVEVVVNPEQRILTKRSVPLTG